jgi:phage tail-like protein
MADNKRTAPYPAYNYLVSIPGQVAWDQPLGGFSEVTGLKLEMHISEYRDGNDSSPHVRKYPGVHSVGDVTFKRGVVDSTTMWGWISNTRTNGYQAQLDITIMLRDEAGNPVQKYKLTNAVPKSFTGPALNGKGSGDVAIEELVVAAEGYEIAGPNG